MSDINLALKEIKEKKDRAQLFIDYYDGRHRLAFASEKFANTFGQTLKAMRENLCQIVVDAPADRMEIINFSSGQDKETATPAWVIWQRELMELYSSDVHREAFKCGEAYLIVWGDEENEAKFYLQDSRQCCVVKDENTERPLFGAKLWLTEEKRVRLTLYYSDRIEKYITEKTYKQGITNQLKESSFVQIDLDGEVFTTPNLYNTIPLFEFCTEPILENAMPVQDRLNKTICDELVAQEFAAYPQRWAVGLEMPTDDITGNKELPFKAGVDRLWHTDSSETKFGEFSAADLEKFLKVEDAARLAVARVTGTPMHFFSFKISDAISGEALKTLESRFTKRVRRSCLGFGAVWSRAMSLGLQIEGTTLDSSLTAQWASPEQRSESEQIDNALNKQQLGVPQDVLLEEIGYTIEDISKFKTMRDKEDEENQTDETNSEGNGTGKKVGATGVKTAA